MIDIDEHVVGSRYDAATNTCHYIVEHQGKRWHVAIPLHELDAHGGGPGSNARRRQHLAGVITAAVKDAPDGHEKVTA